MAKTKSNVKEATSELPSFIINKGPMGLTQVSVNGYKGKLSLDVRFHYRDKNTGKYLPSPKGCGIPLEKSRLFLKKFKALIEEAEAAGFQMSMKKED